MPVLTQPSGQSLPVVSLEKQVLLVDTFEQQLRMFQPGSSNSHTKKSCCLPHAMLLNQLCTEHMNPKVRILFYLDFEFTQSAS